ncbi:MAG: prepilin-type N-terminal cleavage/methylation domain-containing protein [Syntrophotaleaceae bacterium]
MKFHKVNNGFTLVEMIVTLVLIGILAAVAIPRLFDTDAFKSRGFFDEVVNAARYGQKLAVASGCPVEFRITNGVGNNGRYGLFQRLNSCISGPYTRAVSSPGNPGPFAASPPGGVSLSAVPVTEIVFDSRGGASAGMTVTVDDLSFSIIAESGYVD